MVCPARLLGAHRLSSCRWARCYQRSNRTVLFVQAVRRCVQRERSDGASRRRRGALQQRVHDGAVDEEDQLVADLRRVRRPALAGDLGEQQPDLLLVLLGDRVCRVRRVRQLGAGVDEPAAAELPAREPLLEPVEQAQKPVPRRLVRRAERVDPLLQPTLVMALEVRRDELGLAREVPVQRALGDAGALGDRVDAHGVDPLGVEELLRGVEDALARLDAWSRAGHTRQCTARGGEQNCSVPEEERAATRGNA